MPGSKSGPALEETMELSAADVHRARPADAAVAARPPIDVSAMFPQLALISNDALRAAVIATWEELWAMSRWQDMRDVPTSLEIAYPTLPHNQSVLTMALAVADAFETHHGIRVDRDRL